jgi:hypothetical protein
MWNCLPPLQNEHKSIITIALNPVSCLDDLGRGPCCDYRREPVLAGDNRAVAGDFSDVRHYTGDGVA